MRRNATHHSNRHEQQFEMSLIQLSVNALFARLVFALILPFRLTGFFKQNLNRQIEVVSIS